MKRHCLLALFIFTTITVSRYFLSPAGYQLMPAALEEIKGPLYLVYGLAAGNLLCFLLIALTRPDTRPQWWEKPKTTIFHAEGFLGFWMKSLLLSFLIVLYLSAVAMAIHATVITAVMLVFYSLIYGVAYLRKRKKTW